MKQYCKYKVEIIESRIIVTLENLESEEFVEASWTITDPIVRSLTSEIITMPLEELEYEPFNPNFDLVALIKSTEDQARIQVPNK